MRTDVMAFPWRGRRLSMRALTRVPRRRSCCMLGPPTVGTMRHCAIYHVEMSRSPCDRSCKNAHDISLAAKTHVDAWDDDETSQNVPDDERLN